MRSAGPSVASRIFAILDAFVPGEVRLTLSEIARRTGLPLATAHRLADAARPRDARAMSPRLPFSGREGCHRPCGW